MEIDSDLDVYDVERLYEDEDDGRARTVFFLAPTARVKALQAAGQGSGALEEAC
jgi:hypothetical protein